MISNSCWELLADWGSVLGSGSNTKGFVLRRVQVTFLSTQCFSWSCLGASNNSSSSPWDHSALQEQVPVKSQLFMLGFMAVYHTEIVQILPAREQSLANCQRPLNTTGQGDSSDWVQTWQEMLPLSGRNFLSETELILSTFLWPRTTRPSPSGGLGCTHSVEYPQKAGLCSARSLPSSLWKRHLLQLFAVTVLRRNKTSFTLLEFVHGQHQHL